MAIDFTTPAKTQNYDTGVLASIRANQSAIASFLDGHSITGNFAGLKRYNATSSLFEKSDGASWTEMPLAYLKLGGGTLTGALTLAADAAANLQPVSLQQMNTALSAKASTSALASYAPLAGAAFTGSISTTGNATVSGTFNAGGAIGTAAYFSATGAVYAGEGPLTTKGTFYLGTASATQPILNFDGGDYIAFERSTNVLNYFINGGNPLIVATTGITVNGSLTLSGSGGAGYGSNHRIVNTNTGGGPYLRVASTNGLELVNSAYSQVNFQFKDNGDFISTGLSYGRGGGLGLGQISLQSGGSPSGGADGDLCLIY